MDKITYAILKGSKTTLNNIVILQNSKSVPFSELK